MRRTRASYAIRQVRENDNSIVKQRVAESFVRRLCPDFWAEIKEIRGDKASISRVVDGWTDQSNSISELFADKYKSLYTSVPYDSTEMQDFQDRADSQLKEPYA